MFNTMFICIDTCQFDRPLDGLNICVRICININNSCISLLVIWSTVSILVQFCPKQSQNCVIECYDKILLRVLWHAFRWIGIIGCNPFKPFLYYCFNVVNIAYVHACLWYVYATGRQFHIAISGELTLHLPDNTPLAARSELLKAKVCIILYSLLSKSSLSSV